MFQTKIIAKNQNTHFVFGNVLSKIVPLIIKCRKIFYRQQATQMTI